MHVFYENILKLILVFSDIKFGERDNICTCGAIALVIYYDFFYCTLVKIPKVIHSHT